MKNLNEKVIKDKLIHQIMTFPLGNFYSTALSNKKKIVSK